MILGQEGQMDVECLTGTLRFCEIFRKGKQKMDVSLCPPLVAWQAGRKQLIERLQLARILNIQALRDSRDLQLNIDLLDSEGK